MPPQTTKASRPMNVELAHLAQLNLQDRTVELVPIHIGEIGDLAAFVSFMALSGFPLLAASCRANLSFALRCCGVCAWEWSV